MVWYWVTIWRRRLSQQGDSSPSSSSSHTLQARHTHQVVEPAHFPGEAQRRPTQRTKCTGSVADAREGPGRVASRVYDRPSRRTGCMEGRPRTTWQVHREAFYRNLVKCSRGTKRKSGEESSSAMVPTRWVVSQTTQAKAELQPVWVRAAENNTWPSPDTRGWGPRATALICYLHQNNSCIRTEI